ncbi:MAG: polysaccharide pyruvyl transferase family protein [Pseudomonadota bacterium]
MTEPLKLYWWNAEPNFGDAINPAIVAHVSGREVLWVPAAEAELLAIGSVLGFARARFERAPLPFVWGAGALQPPTFLSEIEEAGRFCAVRGALTAVTLPKFRGALGDAGLLCPRILPPPAERSGIGVVPHRVTWKKPEAIQRIRQSGHKLIDVRNPDPWAVVAEIAACEAILSSSLHGLVVADAYQIPNLWVGGAGNFKFYDYFYSVGRRIAHPLWLREGLRRVEAGDMDTAYLTEIPRVQDALSDAFPDELKGS